MKYVTKKKIVIPAGTVFDCAPSETKFFSPHVEAIISLGPDNTMSLIVPVECDQLAFKKIFTTLKE